MNILEFLISFPNQFWVFLTLLASGLGWYIRRNILQKQEEKNIYSRVLPAYEELHESLNDIVARSKECTRALILKCENGGGVPELGKPIHSSVVIEARKVPHDRKKEWQKQQLDPIYIKNLLRVITSPDKSVLLTADDFKGSILSDIYDADGILCTKLSHLNSTKNAWYYLSCTFNISKDNISSEDRNIIRYNVNRIRKILEKNKDILY